MNLNIFGFSCSDKTFTNINFGFRKKKKIQDWYFNFFFSYQIVKIIVSCSPVGILIVITMVYYFDDPLWF